MESVDVIIIGAGIAGASLAAELAGKMSVVVLEREDQPGYHSTGRSAAIYTESYGNQTIRALTSAGRDFFSNPPAGFSDVPLWRDRGVLFIGREDQRSRLDEHFTNASDQAKEMRMVTGAEVKGMVPVIDDKSIVGGVFEPDAMELDVDAIHTGFLRQMKRRGGQLVTQAEVLDLRWNDTLWTVETSNGRWESKIIVNAAGAWADKIAIMAGVEPLGVQPMRRTALTFSCDDDEANENWPMVVDVDEEFYFKPEAGKILGSPADETEIEPCDVQPEDLDVAIAIDRIQRATTLGIKKIDRKWAGLRTFALDKTLIAGFDTQCSGFFWLAGQGGYGIQTSPAMGRVAASLIENGDLPEDIKNKGVTVAALSPGRFKQTI